MKLVPMNLDDGPLDPFLDDPDDPASLLDDAEPAAAADRRRARGRRSPTSPSSRPSGRPAPQGVEGISVDCADCGEQHYFGWDLMAANLRALLGEGRTHVHEPAFSPDPDAYVSWDYARGYTDAVQALTKRL